MPPNLANSNNNRENYSWILFELFPYILREMSNFYRKIIKEVFMKDYIKVGDVVRVRENIFIDPENSTRPLNFYPVTTIYIYNLGDQNAF